MCEDRASFGELLSPQPQIFIVVPLLTNGIIACSQMVIMEFCLRMSPNHNRLKIITNSSSLTESLHDISVVGFDFPVYYAAGYWNIGPLFPVLCSEGLPAAVVCVLHGLP